jgi:hypothetical protein
MGAFVLYEHAEEIERRSREVYERRSTDGGLDEAVKQVKNNAADALRRLNVEDSETTAGLQAIVEVDAALRRFVDQIPKHPLPVVVEPYTCLHQAMAHLRFLRQVELASTR